MAVDATKSTLAPVAPAPAGGNSSVKGGSKGGVGATPDSMSSAAVTKTKKWVAHGATSLYSIVKWPFSFAYKLISAPFVYLYGKIWGPTLVTPTTIKVSAPGWVWGTNIQEVAPGYALSKGWITYEQARDDYKCNDHELRSEGRQPVKFNYLNWRGAETPYEGSLRYALQHNYITVFEAIKQKFITKNEAIDGKWTTAEALTKAEKEAQAKKAAKVTK